MLLEGVCAPHHGHADSVRKALTRLREAVVALNEDDVEPICQVMRQPRCDPGVVRAPLAVVAVRNREAAVRLPAGQVPGKRRRAALDVPGRATCTDRSSPG